MEIVHRISFSNNANIETNLELLGVKLNRSPSLYGHYLVSFTANESSPVWLPIMQAIQDATKVDLCDTVFTQEEVLASEWIRLKPTFEQGYPQPDNTWIKTPHNLVHKCPECGAGYTQIAPYRFSREPKMKGNDFLCLYWTYVTAFCTKEVVESMQNSGIRGYKVWDVMLHSTNKQSKTISQLVPTQITSRGLAIEPQIGSTTCNQCGITKYAYHKKGYMCYARDAISSDVDMQYTGEWFGSGGAAFQEIIVSNRFAKLAFAQNWKGIAFKPLRIV